jgi:hypothetical protein
MWKKHFFWSAYQCKHIIRYLFTATKAMSHGGLSYQTYDFCVSVTLIIIRLPPLRRPFLRVQSISTYAVSFSIKKFYDPFIALNFWCWSCYIVDCTGGCCSSASNLQLNQAFLFNASCLLITGDHVIFSWVFGWKFGTLLLMLSGHFLYR